MAVSSDINPGTAPIVSLRMAMNMACTLFGLTPVEAMAGVTRHAARALGEAGASWAVEGGYAGRFSDLELRPTPPRSATWSASISWSAGSSTGRRPSMDKFNRDRHVGLAGAAGSGRW